MMNEILNVKAGDKVIYHSRWSPDLVANVEKITPTSCIRVNGRLFLNTGQQKGGDAWSRDAISIATKEKIDMIEREKFVRFVLKK